MMYDVVFKNGIAGFLIRLLFFLLLTAALAIAIRCVRSLRKQVAFFGKESLRATFVLIFLSVCVR